MIGREEYVLEQRFYFLFFLFFGKVNSKSDFDENSFEKLKDLKYLIIILIEFIVVVNRGKEKWEIKK